MHWLALEYLWVTAIIPFILLLYLLKRKYEPKEVASLLLWQQVLREQEAAKPWQKLRVHLLLWLQLLIAVLFLLALLRPALPVEEILAQHTVVVLDSSGSMLALEEGQSRFDRAKEKIEELIDLADSKQRMTLVEIGQEPKVWLANSGDKGELKKALEQIEARPGSGNHQAAWSLAVALAQSEQETGILWFGDGPVADSGSLSFPEGFAPSFLEQMELGQNRENVALSTFVTRARDGKVEGLIRLDNYGLSHRQGKLYIYNDQDQLIDSVMVEIARGGSFTHTMPHLPPSPFYRAELELAGDGLLEDNQLWSVPFSQGEIRAVLVSPTGNRFLSQALTLGNRLQLERMNRLPEVWPDDIDLWIFDGLVPDTLPAGNLLLIGPGETTPWLPYEGTVELFEPLEKRVEPHPLLEHSEWSDIYVSKIARLGHLPEMESLVQAGEESILLAGQIQGRKAVVLNFNLYDSDFPLRTTFPIFIQQAISWLAPIQSMPIGAAYPGEPLVIPLTPGAEERSILGPDGSRVEVATGGATSYLYQVPEQLGLFQLREVRGSEEIIRYFTVQMKPSESQIALEPIPYGQAENTQADVEETEQESILTGRKELGHWLALLALLLVMVEWVVYQRGY